jgi:hypothetical protein
VTRLQGIAARNKGGWKDARDAIVRAQDALKAAKTTWARADNKMNRKRAMLASTEAMLKTVGERAVEASTATAVAKAARDEAKKLVAQVVALKLVCSQPESDWSQS